MIAAACHIHSTWSYDGKWTLPELAAEFGRRGYRVLLTTEHDLGFSENRRLEHRAACAAASTDKILVLPGIEYSDDANLVHVLTWGAIPFIGEKIPTTRMLEAVRAANGIAVLAHPSRKAMWQKFDPQWTNLLLGIEVWNRKTDGWAPSAPGWELVRQTKTLPFVGMDFHDRNQFFPLTTMLDLSGPVNEENVLSCLRNRRCHNVALNRPVESISRGALHGFLRSAEWCRRRAAKSYRAIRKRKPAAK